MCGNSACAPAVKKRAWMLREVAVDAATAIWPADGPPQRSAGDGHGNALRANARLSINICARRAARTRVNRKKTNDRRFRQLRRKASAPSALRACLGSCLSANGRCRPRVVLSAPAPRVAAPPWQGRAVRLPRPRKRAPALAFREAQTYSRAASRRARCTNKRRSTAPRDSRRPPEGRRGVGLIGDARGVDALECLKVSGVTLILRR
jgi:hypothetical protein